jgi:tRNA-dihydrouridine synthase 1
MMIDHHHVTNDKQSSPSTTSSQSCSSIQPESPHLFSRPKIPVDRHWITKLLQKYPNPQSRRNDVALVCAPMVDQSDLPFRLLCRRYGSNICFTPMIHAKLAATNIRYRNKFFGCWLRQDDRPLIAQICGSNIDYVLQTAKLLEPYVDGIDLNCGCPQQIAKKGHYGAFLLEQEEILINLIRHLIPHLQVPLSVKVRLLPPPDTGSGPIAPEDKDFDVPTGSLQLYEKLVDAGIHLLTIHGRTRKQKAEYTGHADWSTIRRAVDLLGHRIPIFANGSIQDWNDVEECLHITHADGIMSSESLLEYPPLFYKISQTPHRYIGRLQLAKEYIELAKQYPPQQGGQGSGFKCIRMHLHRFLHKDLQSNPVLRQHVVDAISMEELHWCLDELQLWHKQQNHTVAEETLSWYRRHRDGLPPNQSVQMLTNDDNDEYDDCEEECDEQDNISNFFEGQGNNDDGSGDY